MDLTGKQFIHFKVVRFICRDSKVYLWLCKCECGNDFTAYNYDINQSKVISCGCIKEERKESKNHSQKHFREIYVEGTSLSHLASSKVFLRIVNLVLEVSFNYQELKLGMPRFVLKVKNIECDVKIKKMPLRLEGLLDERFFMPINTKF